MVLQFADDLIIIGNGKSIVDASVNANNLLRQCISVLETLKLSINPSKCSFMRFNDRTKTIPQIQIQNINLEYKNSYTYLGITFDSRLTFSSHIKNTIEKGKQRLNFLKAISGSKWGAHPLIKLRLYKTIVLLCIDYGATIYRGAAKSDLVKLDRIHNMGIRISLGALNSSPVHAMLAEAGEYPLSFRRQMISVRDILKCKLKNIPIFNEIKSISEQFQNNKCYIIKQAKYWENIVDQCGTIFPKSKPKNLIVKADLDNFNCNKTKKTLNKEDMEVINKEIEERHKNRQVFYTDGSKQQQNTGFAIFHENKNTTYKYKINEQISIMSAELLAIKFAIKTIIYQNLNNGIIFTDSKASCLTLQKETHYNIIAKEIEEIMDDNPYKVVEIQWIPSHKGIPGNEKADEGAKKACEDGMVFKQECIEYKDLYKMCVEKVNNVWQEEYRQLSGQKGTKHFEFMEHISEDPWFKKSNLTAEDIRFMTRIRLNHGLWKSHLKKIKIIDSDMCEKCNKIETINHILLECDKFKEERRTCTILLNCDEVKLSRIIKTKQYENYTMT